MNPKIKPCKFCQSTQHWPFQCRQNPKYAKYKMPTSQSSSKEEARMKRVRALWYKENPPDQYGMYICYLNIAPQCPVRMYPNATTLDHVKPKGSHPKLKYVLSNLKPACFWCNTMKGSQSLEAVENLRHFDLPE